MYPIHRLTEKQSCTLKIQYHDCVHYEIKPTLAVKTDRFDSCQNADVAGIVDRLKHSPAVPLPVQSNDGGSKGFGQLPRVILWVPPAQNIHKHDMIQGHSTAQCNITVPSGPLL